MGIVKPLTKEQAAPEIQETFAKLAERAGKVPNFFAAMAHRPAALNAFLPLYKIVVTQGTVDAKFKELAYLRASMVNGCEYCSRAHMASSKSAGVTAEQIAALPFYNRSPLFDEKEKAGQQVFDHALCAEPHRNAHQASPRQQGTNVEVHLPEHHDQGDGPDQPDQRLPHHTAYCVGPLLQFELGAASSLEHHFQGVFPQRPDESRRQHRRKIGKQEDDAYPNSVKDQRHIIVGAKIIPVRHISIVHRNGKQTS